MGFRSFGASVLWMILLGTLIGTEAKAVDGYVGLQAGGYVWPAYSNRNQVEADTLPGVAASLLGGVRVRGADMDLLGSRLSSVLSGHLGIRSELEVSQRFSAIHGVNDVDGQRTADGQTLYATSLMANTWPEWAWDDRWSTYAGAGVGVTWVRALGSDASVFSVQTGAGVLVDFTVSKMLLTLDVGWRSLWQSSVQLTAGRTDFDAHGGAIGLHLRF